MLETLFVVYLIVYMFWPGLVVAGVVFSVANFQTVQVTTIYLHRSLTHGSVVFVEWFQMMCRIIVWTHTGIIPREWRAVHRYHHAHADEEGDPHSPQLEGLPEVQFGNVFYYVRAKGNPVILEESDDIRPTKIDRVLFDRPHLGLFFGGLFYTAGPAALGFAFGGPELALQFGIAGLGGFIGSGLFYIFVESPTINGLGHHHSPLGDRTYERGAAHSYNLHLPGPLQYLLTWFLGGEENHNNHHGSPGSAHFAHRRDKNEKDSGGAVIDALEKRGIATKVKDPHLKW